MNRNFLFTWLKIWNEYSLNFSELNSPLVIEPHCFCFWVYCSLLKNMLVYNELSPTQCMPCTPFSFVYFILPYNYTFTEHWENIDRSLYFWYSGTRLSGLWSCSCFVYPSSHSQSWKAVYCVNPFSKYKVFWMDSRKEGQTAQL